MCQGVHRVRFPQRGRRLLVTMCLCRGRPGSVPESPDRQPMLPAYHPSTTTTTATHSLCSPELRAGPSAWSKRPRDAAARPTLVGSGAHQPHLIVFSPLPLRYCYRCCCAGSRLLVPTVVPATQPWLCLSLLCCPGLSLLSLYARLFATRCIMCRSACHGHAFVRQVSCPTNQTRSIHPPGRGFTIYIDKTNAHAYGHTYRHTHHHVVALRPT